MNPNIEASLVNIRGILYDVQEALYDITNRLQGQDTDNAIAAKNALVMNKKLARALAYYYTPTAEEYLHFDQHCNAISAAGGCPPDPELYWSELAFNHWKYQAGESPPDWEGWEYELGMEDCE